MNTRKWTLSGLSAMMLMGASVLGYRAPQAHWMWEESLTWEVPAPYGLAVHDHQIFVLSQSKVKIYDNDGTFVREFGGGGTADGQFTTARYLAIYGDEVYVTDQGAHRIQVFNVDGTFLRKWGSAGSGPGELSSPRGIAVDDVHVFVSDYGNHRVQAFLHDGTFDYQWGEAGTLPGRLQYPQAIAIDEEHVYVSDAQMATYLKTGEFVREWDLTGGEWMSSAADGSYIYAAGNNRSPWTHGTYQHGRLYIFNKDGTTTFSYVNTNAHPSATNMLKPFHTPVSVALDNPFVYVSENGRGEIAVFRMVFRTVGSPGVVTNVIPTTEVISVEQRAGTAILDVEYRVVDDEASVTTGILAFSGPSATDLSTVVPVRTLVEGTESNVGTEVTTGTVHKISWDMAADWGADYGDLRVAVLAKDARGFLDLHFLHLPAVGGNPAFVINRLPIQENDLLNLWFWQIASGNPNISLQDGQILGVGGLYDGVLLNDGTASTAEGRTFLFSWLGLREATADELQRAREGSTPGSVIQWADRFTYWAPSTINEFGFDTGSTTGWWVVKE